MLARPLLILLIIGISSCNTTPSNGGSDQQDGLLAQAKIENFFLTEVCDNQETAPCLQQLFASIHDSMQNGVVPQVVPPKQVRNFISSLSPEEFGEIWMQFEGTDRLTGKTKTFMQLDPDGVYLEFLGKQGESNALIKDYRNAILMSGEIPPGTLAKLMKHYSQLDFNDPDIQFFLMMHWITYWKQLDF